jgi:dihydrodipicolinate synthase/N-acetylneuraminate lyase
MGNFEMGKPPSDIKRIDSRRQFGRKVQGIAAALLPFQSNGRIAVEAFQRHVAATHAAGLTNAVNMDTGYVNYLSETRKNNVLAWTRAALGKNVPFVAGAYIENLEDDVVTLYRRQLDSIVAIGGIPILFQTARLKASSGRELAATYQAVCRGYQNVLAFELGPMFADNGKIFDSETIVRLMDIPEIIGMKHSSLDRLVELERLALRDRHRPDFRIFTGNDLGINMIEYGSDYLLGLATFAPEQFAERDRLWQTGNPAYYALSDALQHLGNVAFRHPVPAYKHSAALFLHLCGRIPTAKTHPKSPKRPAGEIRWLQDCARRLADTRRNRKGAIRDATNDAQQPRGPSL